jgi:hypothetical protein
VAAIGGRRCLVGYGRNRFWWRACLPGLPWSCSAWCCRRRAITVSSLHLLTLPRAPLSTDLVGRAHRCRRISQCRTCSFRHRRPRRRCRPYWIPLPAAPGARRRAPRHLRHRCRSTALIRCGGGDRPCITAPSPVPRTQVGGTATGTPGSGDGHGIGKASAGQGWEVTQPRSEHQTERAGGIGHLKTQLPRLRELGDRLMRAPPDNWKLAGVAGLYHGRSGHLAIFGCRHNTG